MRVLLITIPCKGDLDEGLRFAEDIGPWSVEQMTRIMQILERDDPQHTYLIKVRR